MQFYTYRSVKAIAEHRYSQFNHNQDPKRQRPEKIWRDEIWPNGIWRAQIPVQSEHPVSVRAPDRWRAA